MVAIGSTTDVALVPYAKVSAAGRPSAVIKRPEDRTGGSGLRKNASDLSRAPKGPHLDGSI
jgi:hypothetical protein